MVVTTNVNYKHSTRAFRYYPNMMTLFDECILENTMLLYNNVGM
jgi:hypothetical protein